jgi:rhodanese-related sulfurtransferase
VADLETGLLWERKAGIPTGGINRTTSSPCTDVRTPAEYATGHIPGAVNIPFDQVAKRIADVDAPHGVALYCMMGPRARKGESALLAAGYEEVFHVEGGLAAWQAAGLPVEVSP